MEEFDKVLVKLQAKIKVSDHCPSRPSDKFDVCKLFGTPNMVQQTYSYKEHTEDVCEAPPVLLSSLVPSCVFTELYEQVT